VSCGTRTVSQDGDPRPSEEVLRLAIDHLEQARRWGLVRPRNLRLRLAALYQESGASGKARNELNALLANEPEDHASRLQLAQLWLLDGRLGLARQQIQMVVESTDELKGDSHRSHGDRAIQAASQVLWGDLEARSGNHAAALRHFDQALRVQPRNVQAHLARGAMLATIGRLEEAAASFRTGVQLRPDSAAAHNNLAALLARTDRNEEALQHYHRSLVLMPDNPLAECNVGLLLTQLARYDEAERAFQRALKLQPDYAAAHEGLARLKQSDEPTD